MHNARRSWSWHVCDVLVWGLNRGLFWRISKVLRPKIDRKVTWKTCHFGPFFSRFYNVWLVESAKNDKLPGWPTCGRHVIAAANRADTMCVPGCRRDRIGGQNKFQTAGKSTFGGPLRTHVGGRPSRRRGARDRLATCNHGNGVCEVGNGHPGGIGGCRQTQTVKRAARVRMCVLAGGASIDLGSLPFGAPKSKIRTDLIGRAAQNKPDLAVLVSPNMTLKWQTSVLKFDAKLPRYFEMSCRKMTNFGDLKWAVAKYNLC
jgi:hypothetical protein